LTPAAAAAAATVLIAAAAMATMANTAHFAQHRISCSFSYNYTKAPMSDDEQLRRRKKAGFGNPKEWNRV
jgi:hypothetical protein